MTSASLVEALSAVRWGRMLLAASVLTLWMPCVFAQDEKGCEGVGYAKQPPSQYSPENLRKRLQRDPADVDALINLGSHWEEQGQLTQAYALYERAIQAKPDCDLGYYFGGLVEDRISEHAASDAEAKIHRAISLDPSLGNDPNVEGFFKRHSQLVAGLPSKETRSPSATNDLLASANRFVIGMGVGFLLATPFVYLARRKTGASG